MSMKYIFMCLLTACVLIPAANGQSLKQFNFPKGTVIKSAETSSKFITKGNEKVLFKGYFEGSSEIWAKTGNWGIGAPSGRGGKLSSSNCAAIKLNGNYSDNADDWLISPIISLPPAATGSKIILSFNEWFETESHYDYGYIKVSTNNGTSWITLGSRDGSSNWRQSTIELTRFANKQIKIGFNFKSDASINYGGWIINDIAILKTEADPITATLTSINSQSFPSIYTNVTVDSSGAGFPGLTKSNFEVYENGILQTNYFSVVPPDSTGGVRMADIIFVLDITGSMTGEIDAVKSNMLNFVTALNSSGVNYGIGIVEFGDIVYTYNSGNLYYDQSQILSIINNISLGENGIGDGGDGPENQLAAMYSGTQMNFRPGARRIEIMITDAVAHENDYETSWSTGTLIPVLKGANITVYPVFDVDYSDQLAQYLPIAQATNPLGTYFDVYSDFTEIISEIHSSIASNYVVSYRSSDPTFNNVQRNVEIRVTCGGFSDTATGSYTPGTAPLIQRTAATIALHNQSWTEGTTFNIDADITDNVAPYLQSAYLNYRKSGSLTYNSLLMTLQSGNTYRGIIPGSAVLTPGIDYYITATDGISTSSDPKTNPSNDPYQIGILPNVAPLITHTPVTSLIIGTPITITANITDNTNYLAGTKLFYRKTGQLIYEKADMTNTDGNNYAGLIPSEFATSDGVEYYIYAVDNYGVSSTDGTADFPHIIDGKMTIEGNVQDFKINLSTGEIENPNLEVDLQLFKGDILSYSGTSGTDGKFSIPVKDLATYRLEISKSGTVASTGQNYTLKVSLGEVKNGQTISNIRIPFGLIGQKYAIIDSLEHLKVQVELWGGFYQDIININGYDENSTKDLVAQWSTILNNYDNISNSLARLLAAEKNAKDYFGDASLMTVGTLESFYSLGQSVFNAIQISEKITSLAGGKNSFITKLIIKLASEVVIGVADIGKLATTIACSMIAPPEGPMLKTIFNSLFSSIEAYANSTEFITNEGLKALIIPPATKMFLEGMYVPKLTQKHLTSAEIWSSYFSYSSTFTDGFNQGKSIYDQSHKTTMNINTAADILRISSGIMNTATDISNVLATISAATGLGAPIAATLATLSTTLKTFSVGTAASALGLNLEEIVSIPGRLGKTVNVIYVPSFMENPIIQYVKQGNPEVYKKSNNYLSHLKESSMSYNDTLQAILNNISNNQRGEALSKINSLIEMDSVLEKTTDLALIPILSVSHIAGNTITNFDSLYFDNCTSIGNSSKNRQSIYCDLMSYIIDSTNSVYKDSVVLQGIKTEIANVNMNLSITQLANIVQSIPKPPFIYSTKLTYPVKVSKGTNLNVKINFKNYGDTPADSLYLKLQLSSGFRSDQDSVYIGTLDANGEDSTIFYIDAPQNDTCGYFNISFASPNSNSQPISGGLTSYTPTSIIENHFIPLSDNLSQNYPNPFNPVTNVNYSLAQESNVVIKIFNILGKEVATLVNETKKPGIYHIQISGDNLPSGIYIYSMQSNSIDGKHMYREAKKMLLLK
ncbi:MAG: VWA domain-containing protein [Ignavibacteriaceae bacterium]|nr:VWA domain-containing protein [Ignavibacteriaceae bacterium]